jgi:ELWxxDGT repeat protein
MKINLLALFSFILSFASFAQNPILVKDILPGEAQSNIADCTKVGERVFFFANDGVHGIELWVSDGTSEGTNLVKDINPNEANAVDVNFVKSITDLNGMALFYAIDGVHGYELWKSDGTEEGTSLVSDIRTGDLSSNFDDGNGLQMVVMGDFAYFIAYADGFGWEVWRTNGTTTNMLPEMIPGENYNDYPGMLTVIGDKLYFGQTAFNPDGGIYVTDGVSLTTLSNAILTDGNNPDFANFFLEYDGYVYFAAGWTENEIELWRTDGTPEGTGLFADLDGAQQGDPRMTHALPNGFLFVADNSVGDNTLYICDGTLNGITPLTFSNGDQLIVANYSAWEQRFLRAGDNIYFPSEDGTCITDGTNAGTHLLTAFNFLEYSSTPLNYEAVAIGSNVIWSSDGVILSSNGSVSGTSIILQGWNEVETFIEINGVVFMVNEPVDDNPYGDELYIFTPEFISRTPEYTKQTDLIVYPNPGEDVLNITLEKPETNCHLRVLDVNGRVVHANTLLQSSTYSYPTADWKAGIYVVEVISQNKLNTFKWVKMQ